MKVDRRCAFRYPLQLDGRGVIRNGGRPEILHRVAVRDISFAGACLLAEICPLPDLEVELDLIWPRGREKREVSLRTSGLVLCPREIFEQSGFVIKFKEPPSLIYEGFDPRAGEVEKILSGPPAFLAPQTINLEALTFYPQLRRVSEFLRAHYHERLSMRRVAKIAAMEATYFSAFFHQKVGLTYQSWLRSLRIEKAIELMIQQNVTVSEVGEAVGYSEIRSFQRAFKKNTGLTPSDFLKLVRPSPERAAGFLDFSI